MGAARPSGKEAPGQVPSMHWALAGCGHTRRGHRPCRMALDPSPGSGSLSALPQALVLPLLCPVSCEHWRDCGVCHHAPNDFKPSVHKFRSSNILIINSNAASPHSFLLQASNDLKTFILFGVSRMGLTLSQFHSGSWQTVSSWDMCHSATGTPSTHQNEFTSPVTPLVLELQRWAPWSP